MQANVRSSKPSNSNSRERDKTCPKYGCWRASRVERLGCFDCRFLVDFRDWRFAKVLDEISNESVTASSRLNVRYRRFGKSLATFDGRLVGKVMVVSLDICRDLSRSRETDNMSAFFVADSPDCAVRLPDRD